MEKHYCDYCGEEINGKSYRMLINQPYGFTYEALLTNTDPWQKDFELCKICAKVIIPKMMENHLCECEEKSRDDACKSSEGHEEDAIGTIYIKNLEKWAAAEKAVCRIRSVAIPILLKAARRVFVEEEG